MVDRTAKAREKSLEIRREAVRGRSEAVYGVLRVLAESERAIPTSEVARNAGLSIGNARRVLVGLVRRGQIKREDVLQYEMVERPEGASIPRRMEYTYRIGPSGLERLKWLRQNRPWEQNR